MEHSILQRLSGSFSNGGNVLIDISMPPYRRKTVIACSMSSKFSGTYHDSSVSVPSTNNPVSNLGPQPRGGIMIEEGQIDWKADTEYQGVQRKLSDLNATAKEAEQRAGQLQQ